MTTRGFLTSPRHLAQQQVVVLRRRRDVRDAHVVLGAERQEALEARRGVLGALPFLPVRQEQHEAAALVPLLLGAGDELVDDDLRAVREVAELRLPEDERRRVGHRVAELEAHDGVLGEEAVDDLEARPARSRSC